MRLLISLVLLCRLTAGEVDNLQWFRDARFGIQIQGAVEPNVWVTRAAAAGARYVVVDAPDDAVSDAAQSRGLMLIDHANYRNLGQRVPSSPLVRRDGSEPGWEARFAMTDDSAGETSREIIRLLVEIASKGGNLLLALPPRREEAVPALNEIGQWLRINGESIYGAAASPFDRMPFFGRATTKGNLLYVHIFGWPANGKLRLAGLKNGIVSARLLANNAKLTWSGDVLNLPAAAPDKTASVVKLTLDGPPKVTPYLIQPGKDGLIVAPVESCEFETMPGQIIRKDNRDGHVFLSHWTRAIDVPTWKVHVPESGRYSVQMVYAAGKESARVVYTVTMKGLTMGMVKGVVEPTGGAVRTLPASDMELDAGNYMLFVQPENKAGQPAMALEKIILRRIGE